MEEQKDDETAKEMKIPEPIKKCVVEIPGSIDECVKPAFSESAESIQNKVSFKMPALSESKHLNRKLPVQTERPSNNIKKHESGNTISHDHPKSKIPSQLPYKEPDWGKEPEIQYNFEVLKNGQIVSNIVLNNKSFYVFGRMEDCDIVMEHPSVSRYHAILQYRGEQEANTAKGFYVYDLESTHGTFLNKQQVRARTYVKMQVGHILKLGGSSRMYILQGPDDEQEPENEMTITEMKARRKQQEMLPIQQQQQEDGKRQETAENKSDGIDWGFGEDATEDPITENPFALSAPNEDLYLDDPKKTLRGWFEREGYELEYKVEEKGFSHFLCRIELPIDSSNGEAVFAEASVKGKKKEAVLAAALEACRVLDRHGVLRQSQHDSRKRKEKDWESQDFYDSEEDTYLDRTGTIERKRQFRKRLVKRDGEENQVETYDSLVIKLQETEKEILQVQDKLEQASKTSKTKNELETEQDSLDTFMANLQNVSSVDKKAKSQLWLQLSILQQNKLRLEKMVRIAKPTALPSLQQPPSSVTPEVKKELLKSKLMPMIGTMKGRSSLKNKKPLISKTQMVIQHTQSVHTDDIVEEEEEDDEEEIKKEKDEHTETLNKSAHRKSCESGLEDPHTDTEVLEKSAESKELKKSEEILKPIPPIVDTPLFEENHETSGETSQEPKLTGPARTLEEKTEDRKKRQRKMILKKAKYDSANPDYAMWLPPDNQTGDGKTYLNDKFGY